VQPNHIVQVGSTTIELRVHEALVPSVLRHITGTTPLDDEIDALPIPPALGLNVVGIHLLRHYRRTIGRLLRHRCVFEPSCSRYSELAFRRYGILKGLHLTMSRLCRCRPGSGGTDLP